MNPEEPLDDIEKCAKALMTKCIEFANNSKIVTPTSRVFRLYGVYVMVVSILTEGVQSFSEEHLEKLMAFFKEEKTLGENL